MDELRAYAVLGVPGDSPFTAVHRAYCLLCCLYSAENDPSPEAAMKYQEVKTAYAVLKRKSRTSRIFRHNGITTFRCRKGAFRRMP